MNFLAHLYLSGDNSEIIFGNFITDFLSHKELKSLPHEFENGVKLHFFIDRETDKHPEVRKFRKLFFAETRHYAGVILDVIWDHFLARNFQNYSPLSLDEYVTSQFKVIDGFASEFPERFQHIYPRMKTGRWLQGYSKKEAIISSFNGLAGRSTGFEQYKNNASNLFNAHYKDLNAAFPKILNDLRVKSQLFLQQPKDMN